MSFEISLGSRAFGDTIKLYVILCIFSAVTQVPIYS